MKQGTRIKIACLSTVFLIAMTFLGGSFTNVKAASISAGGSTIESAMAITAGTYTVGPLVEKEDHFYSIGIKAGQELVVTGTFVVVEENKQYGTMNTIEIYNDNKESVVSQYGDNSTTITSSALADASKSNHTYYIRISDDTWGTASGELKVAINDRFDAGSATDAGGEYDTAMAVSAGSYVGYLSQVDINDFYAVSAVSGSISAKVTPTKDATPTVKIFDANRKELANEWASNGGEIVTAATNISANQKVYIQVNCDINAGCSSEASQYSLQILNEAGGVVSDPDPDVVTGEFIDYGTVVPVVPTGGATKIDSVVKPPLNEIFSDQVKVKEATTDKIVYVVEREVQATDLETIKAAMIALGYKTKSISADTLIMRKGFKEIKFQIMAGSNQITVTQKSIISPLWIGIVLGFIILIVLIIILIVKRKKPVMSQSKNPSSTPTASETPVTTAPATATPTKEKQV